MVEFEALIIKNIAAVGGVGVGIGLIQVLNGLFWSGRPYMRIFYIIITVYWNHLFFLPCSKHQETIRNGLNPLEEIGHFIFVPRFYFFFCSFEITNFS